MCEKKRIGIMTLSASDNCGSCLQAYALKKILEQLVGQRVDIINFSSKESHFQYDILPAGKLRYPREVIRRLIHLKALIREKKAYKKFRKEYLELDGKELLSADLKNISRNYDIIFFGSDQIWNVTMADFSIDFFGAWTNCKKIAFSPSLGGHNLEESMKYELIKNWLREFEFISVREKKGQKSLEENLNIKVPVLLDPTLMLDSSEWKKIVGEPMIEGDYAFYYSWGYCYVNTMMMVNYHCKKDDLPVIVMDSHKWLRNNPKSYGFLVCEKEGPLAFLNLMYYSRVCYTESFHGTIFAYVFQKDFWMLDTHEFPEMIDARLHELVEMFEISNRIMTPYNYRGINALEKMEYEKKDTLELRKKESYQFLKKGLGQIDGVSLSDNGT